MANDLTIRVSVETLSVEALALYRTGIQKMQAIVDNRGFNALAGLHGVPAHYCPHHQNAPSIFLPWHRAYLHYFEQFLRDQVAGTCIPWWDWSSDGSHNTGVPAAFSDATDPAGNPNPLLKSHMVVQSAHLDRDTRRFPGDPADLPLPDDVTQAIKSAADFDDFTQKAENLHDQIHGWTGGMQPGNPRAGGDMGVIATAAFDPIFFSHHTMIDRIWYLWQLENGLDNIPSQIKNLALSPFPLKVSDVLDITQLGYQYAVGHVTSITT